jgi:uncharacterized protein (DUF302 family)
VTVHSLDRVVDRPMEQVEPAVREALAGQGFGVLTEIDVAGTLKAKLGIDSPALKILGACNPSLAHRALALDPSLALLLPCNVVLEDVGDGRTHVSFADPRAMLTLGDPAKKNEAHGLGEEAAVALRRALDQLGG